MESSQTAIVPVPAATIAGTSESATASTGSTPTTATNSPVLPEAATPAAFTPVVALTHESPKDAVDTGGQHEQKEPKIEQVKPGDMEPPPTPPVGTREEAPDPPAATEEAPEISTTSIEPDKPAEDSAVGTVTKASEQTKEQREQEPLSAHTPDQLPKPSTSTSPSDVTMPVEVSESIPTSTSSPGAEERPLVVDEHPSSRGSPVRTPSPVVESSTSSPEKPVEDASSAVIERKEGSPEDNEDSHPNGVVIGRPAAAAAAAAGNDDRAQNSDEKRSEKEEPREESSPGEEALKRESNSNEPSGHGLGEETPQSVAVGTRSDESTRAVEVLDSKGESLPSTATEQEQGSKESEKTSTSSSSSSNSSNSASTEEHNTPTQSQQAVATASESPREADHIANSDSRAISSHPGRGDYQQPPVSARNPLQFTEVANDEVELKVDGGHLLDRVIKLSLLKGLQDSGKRLAKSSLIISGAGATAGGEGANGEATLATTSSLSKAKSAAAGLRLLEEHKTTPPALVANGGGGGGGAAAGIAEVASSTKEVAEPHQHQQGGRIRHSSDTNRSTSPTGGELEGGVRSSSSNSSSSSSSSSNSSLDFREEEKPPTAGVTDVAPSESESNRSALVRETPPVAAAPSSNEHLPMKARKPQYYASIPDFSKQQFSTAATSTVPTSTTAASAKSLAQLHMKTPDFSRLVSGTSSSSTGTSTSPSSQSSSPSSTTTSAAAGSSTCPSATAIAATSRLTTSELKISNPDFTKGFAAPSNYPPAHDPPQQPAHGNSAPSYVSQDTFSKLIKERNYIADLQLKNPPPPTASQNHASDGQPGAVGSPTRGVVVVDTTSGAQYGPYRRSVAVVENGTGEQEPKAHVIQKSAAPVHHHHHAPKTWNPPEFSSKHFAQSLHQPGPNRAALAGGSNGAGPSSSTSPSSRDPSPAPSSSSSPHQPPYGPHSGAGLVNYTGKAPHAERIIVNNVRTYYPEASVPPSAAAATAPAVPLNSLAYSALPKVKDPEFRFDHNREQLLLQEGTIVTVKQPYSNVGRGPVPPHTATSPSAATTTTTTAAAATIMARSPSLERREAQMLQNSQDILYRDYRQHKKPSSSGVPGGGSTRSPYDPSGYYQPAGHHARPPPPSGAGSGAGLMNPPPPNWPPVGPAAQQPPPHHTQRTRSSPQDNGASPVSSPAPPPPPSAGQHHYHHQQAAYHGGQYKNAPSSSSSPAPQPPAGSGSKYPPAQPHYPSGSGTVAGSGYYKGLDYNMEQKFAEVYQAHAKEKQAAAEATARQSRQTPAANPAGLTASAGGVPAATKPPSSYGAGYEQYHHAYYQQSQATPSPTSTPSPVPSPHHRKYSGGPPSRDPSPLGGQGQPQQQPHNHQPAYHMPPGAAPLPGMYMHPAGPPKTAEQGTAAPQAAASYYQSQPAASSSSSAYSGAAAPPTPTYSSRFHHPAGAVVSPSHPPPQQSVISANTYDRYVHPYASSTQPQHHHTKPPLPYPPAAPGPPTAGRMQAAAGGRLAEASPTRHVSVISPAIPPGYDKKTDAYMSANYRAVGGPLVSPAYQYSPGPPGRSGPAAGPPGGYEGSPAAAAAAAGAAPPPSSSGGSSASSKSVYYPPTGVEPYGRPMGKSGSGSIVTGQAATGVPVVTSNARSAGHAPAAPPPTQPSVQPRPEDNRIADRKFVENMLKKKTSPSSDVMADLQAGKFPTRIPQGLVPKKRAAAAAAAAAAAEAAMSSKTAPSIPPGAAGPPTVPTPAKVAKYEEPTGGPQVAPSHRGPSPLQGPSVAPPFDARYPNHSHLVPREGAYPNYGPTVVNHGPAHQYGSSSKRPAAPEISNGPAVHPSVITTNYHHHPPAVLQQQQQQQQYDVSRYYQHHTPGPTKARDEHVIPVYHQPHLRGGSAAPYSPHAYGYAKEEPNAHPHPYPPPPPHSHSEPAGAFRYGEPLKASAPEHLSVHQAQTHIHYTGGNSPASVPKMGYGASHPQPQHPHHHFQPQPQQQQPQQQQHPQQQQQHHVETPMIAGHQYPPNVHPAYGPAHHHRGADQSVISKLRTSLEMKEYEKQRINQLRKQPSADEDLRPKPTTVSVSPSATATGSVMPSIQQDTAPSSSSSSSSRFRTKGELKGYTPLPTPSVVPTHPRRPADESPPLSLKKEPPAGDEKGEEKRSIVPPVDMDGASPLDILDWGSACNEFVEQLQTGKKRGRRKRAVGTTGSTGFFDTVPVVDRTEGSTDLSAIPKDVLNSARSPHRPKGGGGGGGGARDGSECSSDEDKPLLLLRQQSQQQQKDQQGHVVAHVQPEKVARNFREKQRYELEQKHEAKLGRSSSTDSETARAASAAAQRAKARVRKLRHRSSVVRPLSLKSSDGDGDFTADGAEDDAGKVGNCAKRKRSPTSSSSSSSSDVPARSVKKPESEQPRKRGRPKGTGAGAKRAQQSGTNSRCQTGAIKQEPNENSDLSSDDEPRAVRTPHKNERNGSSALTGADTTRKREGGGGGAGGAGGSSGGGGGTGGGGGGGKAQQGKVGDGEPTCNGGGQKEKNPSSSARKKLRTHSRSKAETSGGSESSSSSSSSSESSEEEEEEEAEETMTRSRSKREAERRRSNSKVLRNDKIVENCPTQNHRQTARSRADSERTPTKKPTKARKLSVGLEPTPKRSKSRTIESDSDAPSKSGGPRKRTRLASKNAPISSSVESGDSGSSSDDDGQQVDLSERLRSRKLAKKPSVEESGKKQQSGGGSKTASRRASTASTRGGDSSSKKKGAGGSSATSSAALAGVKKSLKELNQTPTAAAGGPPDHFYPGWEKEVYEYKRSLKVPPELITIDGGLYMHRISTSLPDLDSPHHSDGSETFSEIVKKLNQRTSAVGSVPPPKRFKTKAAAKQQQQQQQQLAQQQITPGTSTAVKVNEEDQISKDRKKIDDNEKFSSIIELLHRRCIATQGAKPTATGTANRGRTSKAGTSKGGSNAASATATSECTKPKQEYELLPTPGAESESLFSKNSKKKKSLFDTAIFKSRTRTEQKAMQSKEMIREVFGGDGERPQSAPPLSCGPDQAPLFEEGLQHVTYDEKYNEIMRNVDRIVGELDGGGVSGSGGGGGGGGATPVAITTVKQEPPDEEEDDEEGEDEEEDDDTQDGSVRMKDSERDTPSIASERGEREFPSTPLSFNGGAAIVGTNNSQVQPCSTGSSSTAVPLAVPTVHKKRGRGHRTSRRKGSSGFDYIRKKKKPSQQHHHANHQHQHGAGGGVNGVNGSIGVRKVTAFENMEGKDETHISKEIRSWVLNKGVGESVMHKAARLGYTDVIVYCLERLDMDPDLKDNAGYTPLHEACAKGHLDIANYLLQYGASHSEPAPSGMRPLHEAVENSFVEIVRLLLAFGADPMLATYAGMTPMQLAESDDMTLFLEHHLSDVQSMGPNKTGWKFDGPWKIHDPEESGCNVFSDIPGFSGEDNGDLSLLNTSGTSSGTISSSSTASSNNKRCDSNSNIMNYEVGVGGSTITTPPVAPTSTDPTRTKRNGFTTESLPVAGLRNGKIKREQPATKPNEERLPNGKQNVEQHDLELHDDDAGSGDDGEDGEMVFEYEEADRPLPPLYVLKEEYNERWMLMSDLCSFLKFKSKEAVLRQICPNNSTNNQRELIREMKIEEFLARANCLQLLCAGEKLNIHASKVVLVKYNDSVKSLLQVQSVMTRI
uniref:Uncharacterized protein n=1 Tax=Anopheles farauti TaxID=69004 RepID=A0A182Q4G5_9DIPT